MPYNTKTCPSNKRKLRNINTYYCYKEILLTKYL